MSFDNIEDRFDEVTDNEAPFIDEQTVYQPLYEDFKLPTHSRITAINFYGGKTLTYS